MSKKMKRSIVIGLLVAAVIGFTIARHLTTKKVLGSIAYGADIDHGRALYGDKQFQAAQSMIQRSPSSPAGYNMLASAYIQKARETGDFRLNSRAESAINRSLELDQNDFDGHNLQAALLLNYHRFSEALDAALKAKSLRPESALPYAAITDALTELGQYNQAIEAAQTLVNLRPDTTAYSRISYLRCLHGDTDGGIKIMNDAVESAGSLENAAWCRVHLGIELLDAGKLELAEHEFDLALQDLPGYYLGLAAKARSRTIAGDFDTAIELYKQSKERVPQPDTIMALGDLYASLGRSEDARQEYDFLATIERAAPDPRLYARQMALFWADHGQRLDDALSTAREERAIRSDIYTNDLLAWCLFKTNHLNEAADYMKQALSLGTKDGRIAYHAGRIYAGLGQKEEAAKYLKRSLLYRVSFDNSVSSFGPLQEKTAREAIAFPRAVYRGKSI